VTTELVSQSPPCTGGNEAHDVLVGSSIVETVGSIRAGSGAPLARGEGSWLSTELLHRGALPRVGYPLRGGTTED
jgi:hypothetical protein